MSEMQTDPRGLRPKRRAARFSRGDDTEDEQQTTKLDASDTGPRRASFRPPELSARFRDRIEQWRDRLSHDLSVAQGHEGLRLRGDLLRAIATAEELLERPGEAVLQLTRLRRVLPWRAQDWRQLRRLYRDLEDQGLVAGAFEGELELEGNGATFVALEQARQAWQAGEPAAAIAEAIAQTPEPQDSIVTSQLWAAMALVDVALEQGQREAALSALRALIEHLPEASPSQRAIQQLLATWLAACGEPQGAAELLEELGRHRALDDTSMRLLSSLLYQQDRAHDVQKYLQRRSESDIEPGLDESLQLAMMRSCWDGAHEQACSTLESLARRAPSGGAMVALEQRWHLLEQGWKPEQSLPSNPEGEAIIDVLNQMLEGDLAISQRVEILHRLGLLYEQAAELEQAASEVYREALQLAPNHAPTLRALGRIYNRMENWQGVAEMYERELEVAGDYPYAWRKHHQVAELYEQKLRDPERALGHYHCVLENRPAFLPALKATARLLDGLGRHEELCELFLKATGHTDSRRQKLYMLGKIAEIAQSELQLPQVAIVAWEQILDMEPDHPSVFSALGKLYADNKMWAELVELNLREVELLEDGDEIASLLVRSAQVCERELLDPARAEEHYREAFLRQPDHLPALEGLARLLAQGQRWSELIALTVDELKTIDDHLEMVRQLSSLAEICELKLGRLEDARKLHEEILRRAPQNVTARFNLERLYRQRGDWPRLRQLLEERIKHDADSRPGALGELGMLLEWQLDEPADAFAAYQRALKLQPNNLHWLEALLRLHSRAQIAPEILAEELEGLLGSLDEDDASLRQRYLLHIARLRERSTRGIGRSELLRRRLASDDEESRLLLRMSLARDGEREALAKLRRQSPIHPSEWLYAIELGELGDLGARPGNAETGQVAAAQLEQLLRGPEALESSARDWLYASLSSRALEQLEERELLVDLPASERLRMVAHRTLHGGEVQVHEDCEDDRLLRLKALSARAERDTAGFLSWTRAELRRQPFASTQVLRLVELAQVPSGDAIGPLVEACLMAFPVLEDGASPELAPRIEDGPALDVLFEALASAEAWGLLRRALEANIRREDMSAVRRAGLCSRLGGLLERRLGDMVCAQIAFEAAWLWGAPTQSLRDAVRVALARGARDQAIRYQSMHFDALLQGELVDEEACVASGLELAALLEQTPGSLEMIVGFLEQLYEDFPGAPQRRQVRLRLAYACAEMGRGWAAVEHLQHVLAVNLDRQQLPHWRMLVRVYTEQMEDPGTALGIQWEIVRTFPENEEDIWRLVELADAHGELGDCVVELRDQALGLDPDRARGLWRVCAQVLDENLGWSEDAAWAYESLLGIVREDEPLQQPEQVRHFAQRRAACLSQVHGREDEAHEAWRALLREDPYDHVAYQGLSQLYRKTQAFDRARVVDQIARVLDPEYEGEPKIRRKKTPSRQIEESILQGAAMPEELRGGVFDALAAAMPLAEKLWPQELVQRKALENNKRLRREFEPVLELAEEFEIALPMRGVKIWFGDSGPSVVQVVGSSSPVIWLDAERLQSFDEDELRFLMGYAMALAYSEMPALLSLDGRKIWHLLEGVWYRQSGKGFSDRVDANSQQIAQELGSPLHALARHRLAQAIEPVLEPLAQAHCEAWPRALEHFALRMGLILCGDVEAAVRAVLKIDGWDAALDEQSTQRQIRRRMRVAELLNFALDEVYLAARYRLGLGGRPSQVGF